jgi:hypothetical protein
MSHIKTLKIIPTCFDHQMIIFRELLILVKITGENFSLKVWLCGYILSFVFHVVLCGEACRHVDMPLHTAQYNGNTIETDRIQCENIEKR